MFTNTKKFAILNVQVVESGKKWVINMFMGEYHHTLDVKGRIILPAKFRDMLGNNFIITRGLENCLFVYPLKEWDSIVDKLKTLPFTKKDARSFVRFFLSGATTAEIDKLGRTNLPINLCEYANLTKECVIIGVNDRIEIWSLESWNKFFQDNTENFSNLAENLFENI